MISNTDYSAQLLDLNMLTESVKDLKLCVLRSASYRCSREGRPFFRFVFGDANGFSVIGRMFGITDYDKTGRIMNAYIGHVCGIDFETDFSMGEVTLKVSKINKVNADLEPDILKLFETNQINIANMSHKYQVALHQRTADIPQYLTECVLGAGTETTFSTTSDEVIGRGYFGAIFDPLLKLLDSEVNSVELILLILVLQVQYSTMEQSDAFGNLKLQHFIAETMKLAEKLKRLEPEPQEFDVALIITDFVGLLTNTSKVFSPETKLIYDLYRTYCSYTDMSVRTAYLPKQGFIQYGNYTLRK